MNKIAIQNRVTANLERVDNLVVIYKKHLQGDGPGRRSHQITDVLRSSVVMLHATLEDFLRTVSESKLPLASKDVLDDIPLYGQEGKAKKYSLGDLASHREDTVSGLIEKSVSQYLERSNYNNTTEIAKWLSAFGLNPDDYTAHYPDLASMMSRRHNIVHRADKTIGQGRGNHHIQTIRPETIMAWSTCVKQFTCDVIKGL